MRYEIEQMLWNLGAHPDKPGYEQSIRLLELMIDRPIVQNFSSFYQLSSRAQGINASKIEKSVRDMIRNIWETNSVLPEFFLIRGYSKQNPPSTKAFLYTLATYLRLYSTNNSSK